MVPMVVTVRLYPRMGMPMRIVLPSSDSFHCPGMSVEQTCDASSLESSSSVPAYDPRMVITPPSNSSIIALAVGSCGNDTPKPNCLSRTDTLVLLPYKSLFGSRSGTPVRYSERSQFVLRSTSVVRGAPLANLTNGRCSCCFCCCCCDFCIFCASSHRFCTSVCCGCWFWIFNPKFSLSSSPGPSMDPFTPSPRLSSLENASFMRSSKNPIDIEVVIGLDRIDDNEEGWKPSTQNKMQVKMRELMVKPHILVLIWAEVLESDAMVYL
mmetsp:Transcript_10424/g.23165  ORF Transcript_10424/g.23165 Transcript_10424/m.23165 type:complete len:267 (+) Transcript_10424:387-1187(+)